MIDFKYFYKKIIEEKSLSNLIEKIPKKINIIKKNLKKDWLEVLNKIPLIKPQYIHLVHNITAYNNKISHKKILKIKSLLKKFSPWRKGPFFIYNIYIDAEWRADFKWNRIKNYIPSLNNKLILDVGCNNGYYMWRMLGCGARLIIGIDPNQIFLFQFEAIKKLLFDNQNIHFLPIKIENMPVTKAFDVVFSMGVLYHQKSPFSHILNLKNQLNKNGELILETLVIKGNKQTVLTPKKKYAGMSIWFIPSISTLIIWLKKCGFKNIKMVNCLYINYIEQRNTEWANKSLFEYLNPQKKNKTIEGHETPMRAVFTAKNK